MPRQSGGSSVSVSGNPLSSDQLFHAALPPYNVKADGKTVTDAGIIGGQNALSSAAASFTTADEKKLVVVLGAGAPISTTLSSALSTGAGITSLPVAALGSPIPPGGVNVISGANNQKFLTSGALAGATSIPLLGQPVAGLTSALSTGGPITSLPVAALQFAVASGTVTVVSVGSGGAVHVQTFSTTGAAIGATSIPVTSATPNYAFPESATVFGSPVAVTPNFAYPTGSTVQTDIPALAGWIGSVSGGVASLVTTKGGGTALNAATTVTGAECFYSTDDTAALTQCCADAAAVNGTVVVQEGDIGIWGPLVFTGAIEVVGQTVKELYGGTSARNDANWPTIVPYLDGSVLVQCQPYADCIQFTAQGRSQGLRRVGLRFAGRFINTGHGVNNASPSGLGNIGGVLDDVRVFGHDGNHYGFVIDSPELVRLTSPRSYGGGGMWLKTNAGAPGPPGNLTVLDFDSTTFIGGIAQGLLLDASGQNALGMDSCAFVNPEMGIRVPNPVIPNTSPPMNGGLQNPLVTLNAGYMTLFTMECPGGESDVTGTVITWPNGTGCFRTSDFNAGNFAKGGQDVPTGAPVSGTAYANLTGKPIIAYNEFLLQPKAAAVNSTTLNGATNAGATSIIVASATGFAVGTVIQIDTGLNMEIAIVSSVSGTTIGILNVGGWGLGLAHATGVAVVTGAAMVFQRLYYLGGFLRRGIATAPIAAAPRVEKFNVIIPTAYSYQLDYGNTARLWTDYNGVAG